MANDNSVSITQFSDFWVMSYGNWKHILAVFSFHNSMTFLLLNTHEGLANSISRNFWPLCFFFFWGWLFGSFFLFFFFFHWFGLLVFSFGLFIYLFFILALESLGTEKKKYIEYENWMMMLNGCEKLGNEWWKLSDENWVIKKNEAKQT